MITQTKYFDPIGAKSGTNIKKENAIIKKIKNLVKYI